MPHQEIQFWFIILFTLTFLTKLISSKVSWIKVIQIYNKEKKTKQKIFESIPIVFITVMIATILDKIFFRNLWILKSNISLYNPTISIIWLIIACISFIFLISWYYQLGKNRRMWSGEEEQKTLITKWIFSISRHPVYVFFMLFSFSFFLINGHIEFFFTFSVISIFLHKIAIQEEQNLEKVFKDKFIKYKKKVPMYLFIKSKNV